MFILIIKLLILIPEYINPIFIILFLIFGIIPALIYTDGKDEDEYDVIGKIIEKLKGDKNDFFKKKK